MKSQDEEEIREFDELSRCSALSALVYSPLTKSDTPVTKELCTFVLEFRCFEWTMDYSYLNQAAAAAAAGFEASSCALAASEMQCGYGDLSSCSQMSQAAYRYTAARAAGYPGNAGTTSTGSTTPLGAHHTTHSHAHAHHGAHATPCSVMAARSQEVHRHAASIFPSAINLQSECFYLFFWEEGNRLWWACSGREMCFSILLLSYLYYILRLRWFYFVLYFIIL